MEMKYIIDIDGFCITDDYSKNEFLWKELGVADISKKKRQFISSFYQ